MKNNETPLVQKTVISLVCLENSTLESNALRGVLEYFGYIVDIHWVGSRKEFLEILRGNIFTQEFVILSCHGDKDDGIYTSPGEKPLQAAEITTEANFHGKTILNLGCETGTQELSDSFLKSGCKTYIAPTEAPNGASTILFAIKLFYEMIQNKKTIKEAYTIAINLSEDLKMFKLFEV